MNGRLDNALPTSWAASANRGTPGELNSRLQPVLYHDFEYDDQWINTSATITFSGVDSQGDTAATWYELDGAPERVAAGSVTITTEGDHTLVLGATDGLGNETTVTLHVMIANLLLGDANLNGFVDVSDLGILATNYGTVAVGTSSTMATSSTATSNITSKPEEQTVPCDLDNDGRVGLSDLAFFSSVYREQPGITSESPYAYAADFDGSGRVDLGDLAIFSAHYRQGPAEISAAPETALTVAEMPAMLTDDDTAKSVIVGNKQKPIVAAILCEHIPDRNNKVPDEDVAILAQHWMMNMEDMDDDDGDERDAVFAGVGSGDDMLALLDE